MTTTNPSIPPKSSETKISQADIQTIMMSVIHDTKNALFQAQGTLDQLQQKLTEPHDEIISIQQEITGINQSLMRLLTLYKMQTETFSIFRDQYNVDEFLQELVIGNSGLHAKSEINVIIDCDEYLDWYFDADLISNVINSIINNTLRYTKQKITLRAEELDNRLNLSVIDDGEGFPQTMLDNSQSMKTQIDFNLSNSGLGLYFAERIANMHTNNDLSGYTSINNNTSGGGCFIISLP